MAYLIGTDEAGYGPNLGPLIVSTSVWKVDESQLDDDLYDSLSPSVSRTSMDAPNVVTIADSKMLYRPGGDLAALERGVLSAISQITRCPTDWQQLWSHLCPKAGEHLSELPWYKDFQCSIPIDLDQAKEEGRFVQEGSQRWTCLTDKERYPWANYSRFVAKGELLATIMSVYA